MSRFIIVDGLLQRSSPEAQRWAWRAYHSVPMDTEEEPKDALALPRDTRTDYQIIEELEEEKS